jgi:hypothetical protein
MIPSFEGKYLDAKTGDNLFRHLILEDRTWLTLVKDFLDLSEHFKIGQMPLASHQAFAIDGS